MARQRREDRPGAAGLYSTHTAFIKGQSYGSRPAHRLMAAVHAKRPPSRAASQLERTDLLEAPSGSPAENRKSRDRQQRQQ